jgi:1-acyl-sn-glycerol-3-phosphate acyltransferase
LRLKGVAETARGAGGHYTARRRMRRPVAIARVSLRLAAVAVATLACYLALVGGSGLLLGSRRRRLAWAAVVFRTWSRLLGRAMGMRVVVRGRPPRPPFLLVANHLSYMDVLLLGGSAGGVFVAMREIAGWPVLGHLCRLVGTVFVDRDAKRDLVRASRDLADRLDLGRGVILFPEGGIVPGDELGPFRPSLLHGAAAAALPVHWAVVSYETAPGLPPAGESVVWEGPLGPHVRRLLSLPGFSGRVEFGAEPLREIDRKALAHSLHREMTAALGPGSAAAGGRPGPA